MKLEILLSCMYQDDFNIINKSHIQSETLIINQCNTCDYTEKKLDNGCLIRMFYTKNRGLSKSRNLALNSATGDICLICDDDEIFVDDYVSKILTAFEKYPEADIVTFALHHPKRKWRSSVKNVGYIGALKTASYQIAFRRSKIQKHNIRFDETMGSGTGNGGGEECKFLFDCLKHNLKIIYVPIFIASVSQTESQWFNGYDKTYFLNQGWSSKKIMGRVIAMLYVVYFSLFKYKLYKRNFSYYKAIYYMTKGVFLNR